MPPPKEMLAPEKPDVINEIRAADKNKKRSTITSYAKESFISLGSKKKSL